MSPAWSRSISGEVALAITIDACPLTRFIPSDVVEQRPRLLPRLMTSPECANAFENAHQVFLGKFLITHGCYIVLNVVLLIPKLTGHHRALHSTNAVIAVWCLCLGPLVKSCIRTIDCTYHPELTPPVYTLDGTWTGTMHVVYPTWLVWGARFWSDRFCLLCWSRCSNARHTLLGILLVHKCCVLLVHVFARHAWFDGVRSRYSRCIVQTTTEGEQGRG